MTKKIIVIMLGVLVFAISCRDSDGDPSILPFTDTAELVFDSIGYSDVSLESADFTSGTFSVPQEYLDAELDSVDLNESKYELVLNYAQFDVVVNGMELNSRDSVKQGDPRPAFTKTEAVDGIAEVSVPVMYADASLRGKAKKDALHKKQKPKRGKQKQSEVEEVAGSSEHVREIKWRKIKVKVPVYYVTAKLVYNKRTKKSHYVVPLVKRGFYKLQMMPGGGIVVPEVRVLYGKRKRTIWRGSVFSASAHGAAYLKTYWKVACQGEKKYGARAEISVAQGMIESACGTSKKAKNQHNHHGHQHSHKKNVYCKNGVGSKDRSATGHKYRVAFCNYSSSWHGYMHHAQWIGCESSFKICSNTPITTALEHLRSRPGDGARYFEDPTGQWMLFAAIKVYRMETL